MGFRIGIESGNKEILRKIKKPATKPKLRLASKRFQKHPDLFVAGLYMLGFDGETYGQMFETLGFSIEMQLAWSHFSVYQIMEETQLNDTGAAHRVEYRDCLPSPQKVV